MLSAFALIVLFNCLLSSYTYLTVVGKVFFILFSIINYLDDVGEVTSSYTCILFSFCCLREFKMLLLAESEQYL